MSLIETLLRPARIRRQQAVILAATAYTLVACSTPPLPPSSPAQRAADAATASRVQAALAAEPNLFARDIVVSVHDGVVNLSGMAWSDDDIQTAGRVARSVSGVTGVTNQVGLESAQVGR
jgi:osmotically-inducible protein OsmY